MDWRKLTKIRGFKYLVATAVFVLVVVFFEQNNVLVTLHLRRQVAALKEEESELREAIARDSAAAAAVSGSIDALEHYGRENYYMKRPDEDIFVITE